MIAQIYPLKRLSRRLSFFDYNLPDNLEVNRGDLVVIPFRNRTIYGIVKMIKEKTDSNYKLKPIQSKIKNLSLSENEMAFFESMAFDLIQSPAALLYSVLPTPPKRQSESVKPSDSAPLTIPKNEVNNLTRTIKWLKTRDHGFVELGDLKRMTAVVSTYHKDNNQDPISIICPNVRDAELVYSHLSAQAKFLITGQESNNSRYEAWQQFRQSKNGILVGTRLSTFLTHPKLTTTFVFRSSHPNHHQADRNPRYDSRLVSQLWKKQSETKLFFFDVAPRVDEFDYFGPDNFFQYQPDQNHKVINLSKEQPDSPHLKISFTASNQIEQTLSQGEKVLCVYNRKGDEGFGNQIIAKELKSIFQGQQVKIIDKDQPLNQSDQSILLVTQYYYENIFDPFVNQNFGLVVMLDADPSLFQSTFRAQEQALICAKQWQGVANSVGAQFLIQTNEAELFENYFFKPDQILKKDLQNRLDYNQPPAKRWIEITCKDKDQSEQTLNQLISDLTHKHDLTIVKSKTDKSLIQVGFKHSQTDKLFLDLFECDDQFIIDTNAFL
ncbi:hypothetical protein ACFLZY_02695 [Patescibacteria group bacterium]